MTRTQRNPIPLASRLRRSAFFLSRSLRAELRSTDISIAKLSLIGNLHRRGPLTPTDLAVLDGVKVQTLTRSLAELEADGWVTRQGDPQDGRQTLVAPTREGVARLRDAMASCDQLLARAIANVCTAGDLDTLERAAALLDRVCEEAYALESSNSMPAHTKRGGHHE